MLAQTYPHFEIIVVDDGSPDDTRAVAARYPGVRCLRQRNRGLSAARNAGLAESVGAFVVFLDADDRLTPEALASGVREMAAHPECALVAGDHKLIDEQGSMIPSPARERVTRRSLSRAPERQLHLVSGDRHVSSNDIHRGGGL